MKKRTCTMLAGATLLVCLISGCGQTQKNDSELAADWELVEFTVKGETTRTEDLLESVRKKAPAFRCDDGVNCVFSNNGKDHPGTISEKDGQYVISYEDTDEIMTVERSGNELTLVNGKGTVTVVFRTE
ncbi:MAG: hypothetical protein K6C99_06450 [Lachnospiraceae bacterium]|nr:hypothetical protein [Lachnospiraceae bacterium]